MKKLPTFPLSHFPTFAVFVFLSWTAHAQTNLIEKFPAEGFRRVEVLTQTNRFNGQITITYTTNELVWFVGTNAARLHFSNTNLNFVNEAKEKFNIRVELEKVPNGTPAPGEPLLLVSPPPLPMNR